MPLNTVPGVTLSDWEFATWDPSKGKTSFASGVQFLCSQAGANQVCAFPAQVPSASVVRPKRRGWLTFQGHRTGKTGVFRP